MNDLTIVLIVLGLLVATVGLSTLCDRLLPVESKRPAGPSPKPGNEGRAS
jgi:hypothetical protein